ncbi:hypothetical protein YDYSG_65770 [Paenibacillus tyrfis]|nr:hypothetical protein YDYSG_65770 [Paenibacillus tyrfis]
MSRHMTVNTRHGDIMHLGSMTITLQYSGRQIASQRMSNNNPREEKNEQEIINEAGAYYNM